MNLWEQIKSRFGAKEEPEHLRRGKLGEAAAIIALSSITTVVGVAMFAQWSILSNITSGIILFFFFPFRIGDVIQVHDKDFPIQAEIEDIKAFHIYLKTTDGQRITYPNNLLLQKGISIIRQEVDDKEFTD